MSKLKKQLIRLGYKNPKLREHLKPILQTITASRDPEKAINSVRVTIDEMETDPDYRNGRPIAEISAGFYADNLNAHSQEVSPFDPVMGKRLREHEEIIRDEIRKEGQLSVGKVDSLVRSLKGLLRTSKYSHRKGGEGLPLANEILKYVSGNLTRWQSDLRKDYGRGVEAEMQDLGMEPRSSSHPVINLYFTSYDDDNLPDLHREIEIEMDANHAGWVQITRSDYDWETQRNYNIKVKELHNADPRQVVEAINKLI